MIRRSGLISSTAREITSKAPAFLNSQRKRRTTKLVRCKECDEFIGGPSAFTGHILVDDSSTDPGDGHLLFPQRQESVEKRNALIADEPR